MSGCKTGGKAISLGVFALSLALAESQVAMAQSRETLPSNSPDIIIMGRSEPTSRDIEKQAMSVTRVGDTYEGQLARFATPVCPGILGLPENVASQMIDRIRYDAQRVGVAVDRGARCKANIIVAFVPDGGAEIRRLLKKRSFLFDGLDASEAKQLEDEAGPVRAWNLVKLYTRYGEPESPSLRQGAVNISGSFNIGTARVVTVPSSDSHLFTASRYDMSYSVIVINISAIDQLSINQLSDYVAMRTLAKTHPTPAGPTVSTILSLFESGDRPPLEMTRFDLAYLTNLYRSENNVSEIVKISGVSDEYRKQEKSDR